nr:nectin-3 [Lonchura striata domestica]
MPSPGVRRRGLWPLPARASAASRCPAGGAGRARGAAAARAAGAESGRAGAAGRAQAVAGGAGRGGTYQQPPGGGRRDAPSHAAPPRPTGTPRDARSASASPAKRGGIEGGEATGPGAGGGGGGGGRGGGAWHTRPAFPRPPLPAAGGAARSERAGAARPAPLSDTGSVWGGAGGAGSGTGRDRPGFVAAAAASRVRSMAGAGAAAEAAAGFPPSPPPPARRELFVAAGGGASPRWWQRRRRRLLRSALPPGPGLGLLGLVFSHFCCSALAGPVVDPHVTAVWGKKVALKCVIDVNETITQVSWEKIYGKSSETIAVHHPEYGISVQGEYQGRVAFKNYSLTDATIIIKNVSFSDAGEYVCKAVTFPLGNIQSSTSVTVLVEPVVSLRKGPNTLIDGANRTVAATCTAATGKPAAQIDWEGGLGEMESTSTLFPNETVTVVSHYVIVPTRFARGRRITCVVRHPAFAKEMRYPYVLDIQYAPEVSVTGYDGNWFIGRGNVQLKCNADANPLPMEFMWSRLDGQWPEGLLAVNNTLQFCSPLTYNYTGTYICKVTNALGQKSDQKTIYILDPPTTTTRLPTVPWHPSTDGTTGLATEPRIIHFPTSTLPTKQDDTWGIVVGCVVGGILLLLLLGTLGGAFYYKRRKTFRGDYFAKSYIPPSDMQKESQIDVLQSDDMSSYPGSIKKETKHPMNLISKDYLEDPGKPELNNVDNTNRYQDHYERPMDYHEGGTFGMGFMHGEFYEDDDFVSHLDGAVISRREWYV